MKIHANGVHDFDLDGARIIYSTNAEELGAVELESEEEIVLPPADPLEHVSSSSGVAVDGPSLLYATFRVEAPPVGCLWRLDTVGSCRALLGRYETTGEGFVDVPRYLDTTVDRAVWTSDRSGAGRQDAFSLDLDTLVETRLTNAECCVGRTRIWDEDVVYLGWFDGPRGIHVQPVSGGESRRVWVDPREQDMPAIHEDLVVFAYVASRDPENWDIRGADIATGDTFDVCTDPAWQQYPDVHGRIVV